MIAPTIEPMARRHIDAVLAIDELAYANPWSAKTWRAELAARDRVHLVAVDATTEPHRVIVGHAGLLIVLDEVHVTTVAVHPDRGGEGIATRLVLELLDEARRHRATAATLEVRSSDPRTQRLYARFGFRPVGVRRAYYSNPVDDAIVMWLHDLDGDEVARRLADLRAEIESTAEGVR